MLEHIDLFYFNSTKDRPQGQILEAEEKEEKLYSTLIRLNVNIIKPFIPEFVLLIPILGRAKRENGVSAR
jgi:hypothetical protein